MKSRLISMGIIATLSIFISGCSKESNIEKYELKDNFIKGTIDSIIDGDSLNVTWIYEGQSNNTQFYLEGINAPEIQDPIYEKMPFGQESKDNLEKLLKEGDEVYLDICDDDLSNLVLRAFIYIKDKNEIKQINNEQVKSGMAYVKEKDVLNDEESLKLKNTQSYAKENKIGIWSDKDLVADGLFNKKYLTDTGKSLSKEKLEEMYK